MSSRCNELLRILFDPGHAIDGHIELFPHLGGKALAKFLPVTVFSPRTTNPTNRATSFLPYIRRS